MIILLLLPAVYVQGAEDFSIVKLTGLVYPDGSVKIEYELELDPLSARVNMSLLGSVFDDLTVIDDDGLLIDHSISDGIITIDSLGSYSVNVSYFTPSLTNKTGSLWTLNIDAPTGMSLKMPTGGTIVGLNPVPDSISINNNQVSLSMSSGTFSVTYVVSVIGIQNEAQSQIDLAQQAVNQARNRGIIVSEGESLLESSLTSFSLGNYIEAKTYAVQSKTKVEETSALADLAASQISEAEQKLEDIYENSDVYRETDGLIQAAKGSYNIGNYSAAITSAREASNAADTYEPPSNWLIYAILIILIPITAYLTWRYYPREQKTEKIIERYDIDAIFEENTHLRSDEKEVLEFIAEHTEGLFITVIREKFDLPKSTAWRMMQRFEAADIIETKSVRRETHVRINPIWAFE